MFSKVWLVDSGLFGAVQKGGILSLERKRVLLPSDLLSGLEGLGVPIDVSSPLKCVDAVALFPLLPRAELE